MNKSELIGRMSGISGMSRECTAKALNALMKAITETVKEKENVVIPGFGTFYVKHRAERRMRNPLTGEQFVTPAKDVPAFKPGKWLKEAVKVGDDEDSIKSDDSEHNDYSGEIKADENKADIGSKSDVSRADIEASTDEVNSADNIYSTKSIVAAK